MRSYYEEHLHAPLLIYRTKRCSLLKNAMAELYVEEKYGETRSYETNSQ
jgi:hypothetical protein